jgi:hypothetical protein
VIKKQYKTDETIFKGNSPDYLFTLHGKPATDSGLYPWALGSLGRSFLFYAETVELRNSKPLKAISAYYSLFHLGMFAMLAAPRFMDPKVRIAINKGLKGGSEDPSPFIRHKDLCRFLNKCSSARLSGEVVDFFEEMQKTRHFINYGPRVYWKDRSDIYVNTCEIHPDSIDGIAEKLTTSFTSIIDWVCLQGADNGFWIPLLLEQTAKFFNKTCGFYKGWISEDVRQEAEILWAQIYERVLERRKK